MFHDANTRVTEIKTYLNDNLDGCVVNDEHNTNDTNTKVTYKDTPASSNVNPDNHMVGIYLLRFRISFLNGNASLTLTRPSFLSTNRPRQDLVTHLDVGVDNDVTGRSVDGDDTDGRILDDHDVDANAMEVETPVLSKVCIYFFVLSIM